jgi:hypothetical protein
MRRPFIRALAVAAPALLLLLTPAVSSAARPPGNTTTISIKSGALAPGGANLTVSYSCFPFGNGKYFYSSFGDARLGQTNGATGDSFFNPKCNDRTVTQTIFIAGPFTSGDAAAGVFICGFDCNSASREVRLR